MSKKKLTVYDATKEELIQYFFHPIDGGFRIPAQADRFCIWLERKRTEDLIDAQNVTIDASQQAMKQYIDLVRQANDEPDIEKKLQIFDRANKAYERYEKAEKKYSQLDRKINDRLGL